MREATDVLRREEVTGFRAETTIDAEPFVVTDGIARAGAWRATSSFDDPATPEHDERVMDALSSDGSVWMQMRDWPADQAECWLQMSPTQVPLEVSALLPREPMYITLVGYLKATGYTSDRNDTTIHATLNLQAALMLFLVKVIREIEITTKQAAAGNVEVEVGVDGGRITDVELRGADVLTAVDDAGATVSAGGRATLESMDITVSYPVKATKDEIVPPAANLITNVDFSGCGAA